MRTNEQPFGPCPAKGCKNGAAKGMTTCPAHSPLKVQISDMEIIKKDIEQRLAIARNAGYIVTVEQVPIQPLAMGNHEGRVTVRKANAQ